ncbi:uncharacterized protein C8Q71DRAFT_701491 [Rhodofomes roseus]|uniref:Uncharacterized protein n=1 Tax=Rhodofomes roseus TaxID=34475 RepID=A0ABQ8KRI0_9APHY|nr:uncharacterized protein C8Q71DRAFT_701491 [Rhodofomes roseus]KAH9840977.1 hypothetical protein C8Q71DRAFT_701491 [Rhodofomes roseus]
MSTAALVLPPITKMTMVSVWIETLVYGNEQTARDSGSVLRVYSQRPASRSIIVFVGAVWVLIFRRKQSAASQLYLLATSMLLFGLATAHVAISLAQQLQAFVYNNPADAPLYLLNQQSSLLFAKLVLYVVTVFVQDLVLIWRMYAVYGSNWQIIVVPVRVAMASSVETYIGAGYSGERVRATSVTGWVMDLIVNIGVTCAIAYKLWRAGRDVASISSRTGHGARSAYMGILFIVVESGAMFAAATFTIVVLYLNTPTELPAIMGISVVVQFATMTPLLIVVRVGMRITHGGIKTTTYANGTSQSLSAPQFAANPRGHAGILQTHETTTDLSTDAYVLDDMKAKYSP